MVNSTVLNDIALGIFMATLTFMIVSYILDYRKKRKRTKTPFISFIMPTFNDADTIEETIASIFDVYDRKRLEIIVVNDCSRDNTAHVLERLKKIYPFTVITNKVNCGKVASINSAFSHTKGEIICMIDSDMHLSKHALDDMLARLEEDDVGGVSCRYVPINKGFLANMQRVEYGMLSLIQISHNRFSTVSLWGGCMMVKRNVFMKVGLLSKNCLVEDGDLAMKIGEAGWKAQEGSFSLQSHVPDTLAKWYRQKIRWSAGGMQNVMNHFKYFLTHPIVIFFMLTYVILAITFAITMAHNVIAIKQWYSLFEAFRKSGGSFIMSAGLAKIAYGANTFKLLALYLLYPVFSIPYVIVNYPIRKNPFSLLWVFPFAMIYVPIFTIVCLIGFGKGVYKTLTLGRYDRGW